MNLQEIDVGQDVLEVGLFSKNELSVRQLLRQATEVKPDERGQLVVEQELLDGSEFLAIKVWVVLLNPSPERVLLGGARRRCRKTEKRERGTPGHLAVKHHLQFEPSRTKQRTGAGTW